MPYTTLLRTYPTSGVPLLCDGFARLGRGLLPGPRYPPTKLRERCFMYTMTSRITRHDAPQLRQERELSCPEPTPYERMPITSPFPDRIGEIYHLSHNLNQKWYWVPNMKETEILLLKGWDSSNNKKILKFTPHTAFNLLNQNIKKNPRDSIEARVFLVLKK